MREDVSMKITLNLPDNLSQAETFNQERISLSRASKIAGMEVMDFQKLLAERGICVHYDVEDFEQDVQHLRDRGWL
jgi:predicted HTH domain antitoxin